MCDIPGFVNSFFQPGSRPSLYKLFCDLKFATAIAVLRAATPHHPVYSHVGKEVSVAEYLEDRPSVEELRLAVFLTCTKMRAVDIWNGTDASCAPCAPATTSIATAETLIHSSTAALRSLEEALGKHIGHVHDQLQSIRADMAALRTAPPAHVPTPSSYAAAVQQPHPNLIREIKSAVRASAAAVLDAKDSEIRKRSLILKGVPQATADNQLKQYVEREFLPKLQLQPGSVRLERVSRLAGPTSPVLLTFKDVASKLRVRQERTKLAGCDFSIDEYFTKPQLQARSAALSAARQSQPFLDAQRAQEKCRLHARLQDGLFVVYLNGRAIADPPPSAPAPMDMEVAPRPRPATAVGGPRLTSPSRRKRQKRSSAAGSDPSSPSAMAAGSNAH